MDFKKLCSLTDNDSVSFRNQDTNQDRRSMREFMRVADTSGALPKSSDERKSWIANKVKDILSQADISSEDYRFIKDSILSLVSKYESRYQRVSDSLLKSQSDSIESKRRYDIKLRQLRQYQSIGTCDEFQSAISDSTNSKAELQIALKKLEDAEVIIKDKEQAENEYQQQLEEQRKQLELKEQEANSSKEELERLREQLEEQERKYKEELDKAVQVSDSKLRNRVRILVTHRVSDTVQIKDVYDIPQDLLSQFASLFEDWLQTGSAYVEQRLKDVTATIGNETLTTLVNKATSYEPLDTNTYNDLTEELKETLDQNGLRIPSLALISDSAYKEELTKRFNKIKDIPVNDIVLAVQDYVLDANDSNRSKVESYVQMLPESKLKESMRLLLCADSYWGVQKEFDDTYIQFLKLADAIGTTIKGHERFYRQQLITIPTTSVQLSDKPVEPVLSTAEYCYISDSSGRYNRLVKHVIDCCCDVPCQGYQYPSIQNCTFVEGTPYVSAVYEGLSHLYAIPEGIDRAEWKSKFDSLIDEQKRWEMLQTLCPFDTLMITAQNLGQYDIVTDSLLYKRHMSDPYFVTMTMVKDNALANLPKFKPLIDSIKVYTDIKSAIEQSSKVRIAVSDSNEFADAQDFRSIKTAKTVDFKGKTNIRLYLA